MAKDERPIIIKKKKVVGGGGHHGGAWKVAYADFVTAMMAFFMLMWLLNATTEKQRKGLADYFNPTIPITRASGGGEGALSGQSAFEMQDQANLGRGGLGEAPGVVQQAMGTSGGMDQADQSEAEAAARQEQEALENVAKVALGVGGDSLVEELALRHVTAKLTDEGLVIEFFELEDALLFDPGTSNPRPLLAELSAIILQVRNLIANDIAIAGHTRSQPIVASDNRTWGLSSDRAHALREVLIEAGVKDARVTRVAGHADRKLSVQDAPLDIRNNRLEVIFLREKPLR